MPKASKRAGVPKPPPREEATAPAPAPAAAAAAAAEGAPASPPPPAPIDPAMDHKQAIAALMDPPRKSPGMMYRLVVATTDGMLAFYPTDNRLLALVDATTFYYDGEEHRVRCVRVPAFTQRAAALYADGWVAWMLGRYMMCYKGYNFGPRNAYVLSAAVHAMNTEIGALHPAHVESLTDIELFPV